MSTGTLKDGRHFCQYYIDGKIKREYFGRSVAGQKQAQDRDQELKRLGMIRGYERHPSMAAGVTFEALANEYLNVKGPIDMTPSSLDALYYKLTAVILPQLGHLQAAGITHKRLDDYVNRRLATPRSVKTGTKDNPKYKKMKHPDGTVQYIKRTTVHRELCDIQAILNWAVSKNYLLANPVIGHKKPKRDNDILKPPTLKETRAILAQCAPHLIRALKISYFIGLRPGATELFRLTWADVDFEARTLFVISSKKNGLPHRTIAIHDELLPDMVKWEKQDKAKKINHLISYNGEPIKSVQHAYTAAKRRAGITRRIRLYDFRHAFATSLLSAGADLKTVSEMLGHSRPDTTLRIYQHTDAAQQRRELDKLPGINYENGT